MNVKDRARPWRRGGWLLPLMLIVLSGMPSAWSADEPKAAPADAAKAEEKKDEPAAAAAAPAWKADTGDNTWMLISSALVLMMTAPGLALFYGGLVRSKNVLSTIMHSLFLMGLVSVLWVIYGYSIAFAKGNAYFGGMEYFMLNGVGTDSASTYAGTIPHQTFMLFQLMFAIITPALISGAFAERVKFSAMVVFTILWSTIIYFPLAHMVWGDGGLFNWALGGKIPALDFAGGTVVHISAGTSALVFALVLGKRKGYPTTPMLPHNLVMSITGAALLWVGWFGFNAGSALGAGNTEVTTASKEFFSANLAASAFAATHFAAAAAGLAWASLEWIQRGKPSALGTISGIVAGLVAITPASGFVTIPSALLIGLAAGAVCYLAVTKLKIALGYDDSLDAFGVHGVGGTLGAILTGVFASTKVNPLLIETFKTADGKAVNLGGGASQVVNQAMAAGLTIVASVIVTFIILKVVDAVIGLRVTEEQEVEGLDVSLHGEEAYAHDHGGSLVSSSSGPVSHAAVPVGATATARN